MARRSADARTLLFERVRSSPPRFVHAAGVPYSVEREREPDESKVDHVWITFEAPPFGRLRAILNTRSRLNQNAGFDPRVRVGTVRSTWIEKPPAGLEEIDGFDYAMIEEAHNIFYEHYDRDALTEALIAKGRAAVGLEVWGELYGRDHLGVHQIHSRRASSAVALDVKNRDGALKLFYAAGNAAELLLFKFVGQP